MLQDLERGEMREGKRVAEGVSLVEGRISLGQGEPMDVGTELDRIAIVAV